MEKTDNYCPNTLRFRFAKSVKFINKRELHRLMADNLSLVLGL